MTNGMRWTGFLATLVIIIVIPVYSWLEPNHQETLLKEYRIDAVITATDRYAENCAICHGVAGEGIAGNPALNTEAIRTLSTTDLAKVITRGRDGTLMAAWALEEGGVFSAAQVNELVAMIQYGNWDYVEQRVAELGLTPPDLIEFEVSESMLAAISNLPDSERLGAGLTVFAENCAACHNANGSGTLIAPAIDTPELRETPKEEIVNLVNNGVPATLMAGWQKMMTVEQIELVVDLIYRWPEILEAGVEFPETAMLDIPSSPEMITTGNQLFHVACKSCHGVEAYGSPMAPALNNQIFLSETPDAAIYQIIAGGVPDTLMPAWGARLSDYELQTLVAYLRSLEINAPPIVPPIVGE